LLAWSIAEYSRISDSFKQAKASPKSKKGPTQLVDFVMSLVNHFRANSALIRYGAFIALHEAVERNPEILIQNNALFPFIISGSLDPDHLTASICKSLLKYINANTSEVVKKENWVLQSYQEKFSAAKKLRQDNEESLNVLITYVDKSPSVSSSQLQKWISSMEYMKPGHKYITLQNIALWCSKLTTYDTFLIQAIVPLCKSQDPQIQLLVLKIIQALSKSLETSSESDLGFVWIHLYSLFNSQATILHHLLDTIQSLPLGKLLPASRKEVIILFFANVAFAPCFQPVLSRESISKAPCIQASLRLQKLLEN
jgi:hypothetical protein